MGSRTGRVPVVISDRNGRRTTVYRRADRTAASTAAAIPAPATASRTGRKRAEDALLRELRDEILPFNQRTVERHVRSYPDAVLTEVLTEVRSSGPNAHLFRALVSDGADGDEVSEALALWPLLDTGHPEIARIRVRSLRHYPQLPVLADYSKADGQTRRRVDLLLKVTDALSECDGSARVLEYSKDADGRRLHLIRNGALVDYLFTNADRYEDILDVMLERGTDDPALIESMLTHGTQSLRSGVL